MLKQTNSRRTYSKEFKLKAVKMYFDDGISMVKIAKMLGIPEKSSVKQWVKKYRELGELGLENRRGIATKKGKAGRPKKNFLCLEDRIKRLEMENEVLKKLKEYLRGDVQQK